MFDQWLVGLNVEGIANGSAVRGARAGNPGQVAVLGLTTLAPKS
jgi:hypothetical protein